MTNGAGRPRTGRRGIGLAIAGLLGALLVVHPQAAPAEERPSKEPILRIETGMHGARINRLALDPARRTLMSVGDDKTLRLWDLASGEGRRTVRVPMGPEPEGELRALALSASGKTVAVAGSAGLVWDGSAAVYFYDPETAAWKGRASFGTVRTGPINALAFSPDGRFLVAGSGRDATSAGGLRSIDLKSGAIQVADGDYGGALVHLAFAADGRLVTTSLDGKVRLYDAGLNRLAVFEAGKGFTPYGVAFSPDGTLVAVAFVEAPQAMVKLLAADGLKPVRDLAAPKGRQGRLDVVTWTGDGKALAAAGSFADPAGRKKIVRWRLDKPEAPVEWDVGSDDIVTDLQGTADGRLAFATAEPRWGLLDLEGRLTAVQPPRQADFRDGHDGCFAVARDGSAVDFGVRRGGRECARFDLVAGSLDRKPQPRADMAKARNGAGGVRVTDWRNTTAPKVDGRPIVLENHEIARSVAVGGDGGVLFGTEFYVRYYRQGQLVWRTPVPSPAWTVALTADGRYAIAALGDGTLRWLRVQDGGEALAFFALAQGDSWVAWTLEGLFDHGPGGQALIGYHRNVIEETQLKGAQFVTVEQLYGRLFRRDLVMKRFRGEGEAEIQAYMGRIGQVEGVLDRGLPPAIHLVEYCVEEGTGRTCRPVEPATAERGIQRSRPSEVPAPKITLRFEVEDRGGGIGPITVRRENVPIDQAKPRGVTSLGQKKIEERIVPLADGMNVVSLSAFNGAGEIETDPGERPGLVFRYQAPKSDRPVLRLVSVGVNRFADPRLDQQLRLQFAVADAEGVVRMMQEDTSKEVYGGVDPILLTDGKATKASIEKALEDIALRARPQDLALIFLAGHGKRIDGRYHFIPYDIKGTSDQAIRESGFGHERLSELLSRLPTSKTLVAIDTCDSGTFTLEDNQTAGGLLYQASGRAILTGAATQQEALDGTAGHGVFTTALLEALSGRADVEKDGIVDVIEVGKYTLRRVPSLAAEVGNGHRQTPLLFARFSDIFPIRAAE